VSILFGIVSSCSIVSSVSALIKTYLKKKKGLLITYITYFTAAQVVYITAMINHVSYITATEHFIFSVRRSHVTVYRPSKFPSPSRIAGEIDLPSMQYQILAYNIA